jgi:RNA polymerase-binding transcription factor DksA
VRLPTTRSPRSRRAMSRIDAARYGICEQCGLRLQAGWLEASPQMRCCPACRPQQGRRRPSGPAAGSGTS